LQVHLQLGNKPSCDQSGTKQKLGFCIDQDHSSLSCKSTCNWATNLVSTTLASGANTENKCLAWILEHFTVSSKSTYNWATNPVATTLASGAKIEIRV
jgi:hypothetical protein